MQEEMHTEKGNVWNKSAKKCDRKLHSAEKCRKDIVYGNEMYFQKIENWSENKATIQKKTVKIENACRKNKKNRNA